METDPREELSELLNQEADAKWERKLTDVIRRLLKSGETVSLQEIAEDYPAHAKQIEASIERALSIDPDDFQDDTIDSRPHPADASKITHSDLSPAHEQTTDRSSIASERGAGTPTMFGRYRVETMLGSGGFGVVYRAWDEELERKVAVKVARRSRRSSTADEELAEARVLAKLDHPGIVPVYDVGRADNEALYVVSKYIKGKDLGRRQREERITFGEATAIIIRIAKALDYAHRKGVVHRDVKPGNILLTADDVPILVDFGLAIQESEFGQGSRFVGTPAYMSPEQARREGHRVDGRSDIYALGAVYYQLLTGRRPFNATSVPALLELIKSVEVRPPRQMDPKIPRELERVCLRALSKRVSDRYTSAGDMAEDLELWAEGGNAISEAPAANGSTSQEPSVVSRSEQVAIIPRGLRAFDGTDADFFLRLLPGPTDRDGLPECIRFWKTRIEETESEMTFRVGVLLGPSGSGKSSMVRAGIAPHLSENIITVWADTKAADLEKRLLRRIRKRLPNLEDAKTLHDALVQVRHSRGVAAGRKLLLVFDQFEQWLSYQNNFENSELAEALRQCDGVQLQALLLIRDDFTLSAAEFLDSVEEPLSQTRNFATVDLFGVDHAQTVLTAYGRAFGAVSDPVPREQERFIDAVVEGLADNGRIIPIQLALFADMVKDRPWTLATLKEYGGLKGIGVAFLQEKLEGPQAHPFLQSQIELVRELLRWLLPEETQVIKGGAKTRAELIEHFSEVARPDTLDRVLGLLDSELRLITPSGGEPSVSHESTTSTVREPAFQLTHDYLVPAIRSWLTAADRATAQGRWRLQLRELSESWNAKPESRRLPTVTEWLAIWLRVSHRDWTAPQLRMMNKKRNQILLSSVALLLVGTVIAWFFVTTQTSTTAENRRQRLLDTRTTQIRSVIGETRLNWPAVAPLLQSDWDSLPPVQALDEKGAQRRVHLGLALAKDDPRKLIEIFPQVAALETDEIAAIRDEYQSMLAPQVDWLWNELKTRSERTTRLAAASILSRAVPDDPRWAELGDRVCNDLCALRTFQLQGWVSHFFDVKQHLTQPLNETLSLAPTTANRDRRRNAFELISYYAASDPAALANAIGYVDSDQMEALLAPISVHGREAATALRRVYQEASRQPSPPRPSPAVLELSREGDGFAAPRGGYALGFDLNELAARVKLLRDEGQQVQSVRTRFLDEKWVADLAWNSGAETEVANDLTREELQAAIDSQAADGRQLLDVDARIEQNGQPRFITVWRRDPDAKPPRVAIGPLGDEFARHSDWEGFALEKLAIWPSDGEFHSVSIWSSDPQAVGDDSFAYIRNLKTAGDIAPGYRQVDVRTNAALKTTQRPFTLAYLYKYGLATSSSRKTECLLVQKRYDEALAMATSLKKKSPTLGAPLRAEALLRLNRLNEFAVELQACETLGVDAFVLQLLQLEQAIALSDLATAREIYNKLVEQWNGGDSANASQARVLALAAMELANATDEGDAAPTAEELRATSLTVLDWLAGSSGAGSLARLLEDPRFDRLRSEARFLDWLGKSGFSLRFDYAFQTQPTTVSRSILGQSVESHRRQAMALEREGYQLRLVDAASDATGALRVSSVWERPAPQRDAFRQMQRQVNLAIALAHLKEKDFLLEILQDNRGREMRALAIASLPVTELPPSVLIETFREQNATALRRGLLLALGEHPRTRISEAELEYFQDRLSAISATTPDPGLRAAANWCAQRWGLTRKEPPIGGWEEARRGERGWFVNAANQTMVVCRGEEFLMGSPQYEQGRESHELWHWRRIDRSFAIADTETTVAQFKQFLADPRVKKYYESRPFLYTQRIAPTNDCPQISIRWFDAALFCQWLSEKEELPPGEWNYPGIWDTERSKLRLPDNYLERTGYRLPTEAEWEFACRAGSPQARSYGESPQLLSGYAWYAGNAEERSHPVAMLKPNDLGLFDMLGNVTEWCQEPYAAYRLTADQYALDDNEARTLTIAEGAFRVHRGGAYASLPRETRSGRRNRRVPGENSRLTGFRVVRTVK